MIFEIVSYSLSGFFMKVSDELMDEKKNLVFAVITGLLCVLFTILACKLSSDAVCIFLSILIGTALASKVDSLNHILSAVLFVGLLFILGFTTFSWYALILCTIAAFIDEKGNDKSDEIELVGSSSDKGLFYKFFKYRYALKITVFILSLLGLFQMLFNGFLSGLYFFSPLTIIYFYAYDLSYEFAGLIFDRCYNFF
ncbi:MAG: hypothetical protein BZ133_03400 [Methanosphaera sp. SHI613]|jgi:hypothetical protein|nr:MAG: hypothetical protein BZ133_03400 [Methanosphaera sp. SHI613]